VHNYTIGFLQSRNEFRGERTWDGVGEEEVGDPGPEGDPSAICRLGNGLAGSSDSAEAGGVGGATPIIRGFARVFHGFRDGGGRIPDGGTEHPSWGTGIPMRHTQGYGTSRGAIL